MNNRVVLVIGTVPPPIGGVSIYVQRLLNNIRRNELISTHFFDYKRISPLNIFTYLKSARVVHINVSNPLLMFFFCFASKIMGRKIIVTYHGNISGRSLAGSFFNRLSLLMVNFPILLNDASYTTAIKYNRKAIKSTAFIPPDPEVLDSSIVSQINSCKADSNYQLTFCTNAFDVSFDAEKSETYGISNIVTIFNSFPQYLLIFSDPSGNYKKFLEKNDLKLGSNILVIDKAHPFVEIIKLSDVMIRATTTDGDSISLREAMYYNKKIIATDCVSRPEGVVLFPTGNWQRFEEIIDSIKVFDENHYQQENAMDAIDSILEKIPN